MTAKTDAEVLQSYREKRDALLESIATGATVKRYRLGSREKESSDPVALLKFYEDMIVSLESKIAQASQTAANSTNFARVRRD